MITQSEFIDNWYGRNKPNFSNFIEFAIRCVEFANHIAGVKKIGIDRNAETAYMNAKGEIFHPAIWYMPKFYKEIFDLKEWQAIDAAISFHNGAQIHESLHVKLTPLTFGDDIERICKKYNRNQKLFKWCFNLIEDIYIESAGKEQYTNIFPFNQFVNDLFFTQENTQEFIDGWVNAPEEPNDKERQHLLNALVSWKNIDNRSKYTHKKFEPFVKFLQAATSTKNDLKKRLNLADKLYELLEENKVGSDDVGDDNKNAEGIPQEILDKIQKFIEQNLDAIQKIVDTFGKIESELKHPNIHDGFDRYTDLAKKLKFTFNLPKENEKVLPDTKYANFANYVRYVTSPKPDYYLTKDTGSLIVDHELYRINLDGNVLTDKVTNTRKKDKPQFVILVDSSGSMSSIYKSVIKSAAGVYFSLVNADIPVSLWGHSGDYAPLVYGICSYKMPFQNKVVETTRNSMQRISNAIHIDLCENYDGFVIYSLKEYFLNSPKRFMIVLSDGRPQGHGYGGKSGLEHTKKVVDNLRKEGINVYAISLNEDVNEANDNIYSKNFNIKASHNLDNEFKKLIANLI